MPNFGVLPPEHQVDRPLSPPPPPVSDHEKYNSGNYWTLKNLREAQHALSRMKAGETPPAKPTPPSIVNVCEACSKPWKTCNCSEWYAAWWGFIAGLLVASVTAGMFFGEAAQ
jgi:hypothetical protein